MQDHSQTDRDHALRRSMLVGVMAFLTVVDLFGTQAILPTLARRYGVSPAMMSVAVNATTFGMAFAGLAMTAFSHRLDRRTGLTISLLLLAIPTALLSTMPPLGIFALLRVFQGVFMATAFCLTLAYLGEVYMARAAASAFAAYITGNVASNLIGRLFSAALADHLGLPANFLGFALLNVAGAGLAALTLRDGTERAVGMMPLSVARIWRRHAGNPTLLVTFAIGFGILFVFLGTFTYVNFALAAPPFALGPMTLGYVYFVFLPSIFTTPLAGTVVDWIGRRGGLFASLSLAGAGLFCLMAPSLPIVLAGLALVGVGTFLAQAIATGIVGTAAQGERAAASGMYLASYYLGGLVGTAVLGPIFQTFGWTGCVLGIAAVLCVCLGLVPLLPPHTASLATPIRA